MKRNILLIVVMSFMTACVFDAKAQSEDAPLINVTGLLKFNTKADFGFDVGVIINDRWGAKFGLMADTHRGSFGEEDSIGKHYRLSYTGGATYKVCRWFSPGVAIGYGEYGTYGYYAELDKYGIHGKVRGPELGVQLQFCLKRGVLLEIGYGTIPTGFFKNSPFHDITFGIGINFYELFASI